MKIYIKNYNPKNIQKKLKLLDDYYISTKNSIEIISDEGFFYVNDKKFYKMNIVLDKLSELRSNDLELLLDKSAFKNETVHYLPLNHVDSCITTFYYSLNPKSKIKLVIEGTYEMDDDKITNKYQNFIPTNFYFEVQTEITDFELLNNDDLNVFLSVLN
jgi:hypothetical protein